MSTIYIDFSSNSGGSYEATIERLSDGYYREDDSETFVSAPSYPDKNIPLVEGSSFNAGNYTANVDASTWNDGMYKLRIHNLNNASGVCASQIFSVLNGAESVHGMEFAADDIYFAQIKYISDFDNNSDEFIAHWFKNDQPIKSGELLYPSISLYNTVNGAAIFEHGAMNYVSPNLGVVRYNTTPKVLGSGEPYLVEASGIIDSVLRTWRTVVGIDWY